MIYFDHNATTAIDNRVLEAMQPYLTKFYGNPSSLHKMGRVVLSAINTAREQVAALVDASAAQIIFTSGGTEANNLALNVAQKNATIAISTIEHPSVSEFASQWRDRSVSIPIPVDNNGLVSELAIEALINRGKQPELISIMLANNETGAIQDITGISQQLKPTKILMHTDAVQAVGKVPVSFSTLGVDLMSLSSHKIYGPKGCGALVVGNNVQLNPLLIGGGQEYNWRAGTENVAAIVGFGKAAEVAKQELESRAEQSLRLRILLENELKAIANVTIFSEQVARIPNTLQFSVQGIDGEMLLMQLDQKNIAVSSGSACASGAGQASKVLTAMGVDYQTAKGAVRVSLGQDNTEAEVNQFISVLKSFVVKD